MTEHIRYDLPELSRENLDRLMAFADASSDPQFLTLATAVGQLAMRSWRMEQLLGLVFEIVGEHVTVDMLSRHGLLGPEPEPPRR